MSYQPYLIANYATGLDKELQPWLLPDDAQDSLFDGYAYKGVINKRDGYRPLATGLRGGQPYCESRMVGNISGEPAQDSLGALVQGDGTTGPYSFRIQNLPVRRGTVSITAGAQTVTDDGLGGLTGDGTGTIDYTTGDVVVTFTGAVGIGVQIFVAYDYHPGNPVMGIMEFITVDNTKLLIVADTKRINSLNLTTNILESLNLTLTITGITQANPGVITTSAVHNLATGDRIFVYGVLGMDEVNNIEYTITRISGTTFSIGVDTTLFTAYASDGTVELIYSGTNVNFWSWVNYQDKDGNPRLLFSNNKDQIQYYAPHLANSVGDYVHYPTQLSPDFQMNTDAGPAITSIKCLQLMEYKDRLILQRTTENDIVKPRRLRISGTGSSSDDFRVATTGAGFIDVPSENWISGSDFNRDDLLIFTEESLWILKYTSNDVVPFTIERIDSTRGSEAPFGVITYLNRTSAISSTGMIITDGYSVERMDHKLPEFSINEVDPQNYALCFAGAVDEKRDHYLLYPTQGQTSNVKSQRILVTNYEEDNFNINRIALSCIGRYIQPFGVIWSDLTSFDNWDEFAAEFGDWNSFPFSKGTPFTVGGGHDGEVWRMAVTELEDNPQRIRNITIIDSTTLEITTDWNNYSLNALDAQMGVDEIFLSGIAGMVEANNKQYALISVTDNYTFRVKVPSTVGFSSYTNGGTTARVIPFVSTFKKFNPFVNSDKKVRCGWIYFYVTTTNTSLTRNINITNATQANPCVITTAVNHNLKTNDIVNIFSVGGMTELNGNEYPITVISNNTLSLQDVDSSAFTAYTAGGIASVGENAKLDIDIITNDKDEGIQLNTQLQANCTSLSFQEGSKKWYKAYINQVGRFIQFRLRSKQAGAQIQVHAVMPGFQPVGRLL